MKKINIYVNGSYVCSTMQSRTCREAVQKFRARPEYAGMVSREPARLGMVNRPLSPSDKITAHFAR